MMGIIVRATAQYGRTALSGVSKPAHALAMKLANVIVGAVLRSPLHRLMSGSTDVVRYRGQRSGAAFSMPTQYARHGDEVIILVGRPQTKTWWRNFRHERDVDILVRGRWLAMTGRVVTASDEPETIAPLLDAYVARFPKVARTIDRGQAVLVWCRPR